MSDHDPERPMSRRDELKQQLAALEAKRARIAQIEREFVRLNADSDAAADAHTEAAGRLQAELQEIDASAPSKKSGRRAEAVAELDKLNAELETRCSNNRAAIRLMTEERERLIKELMPYATMRDNLARMCSDGIRHRQQAAGTVHQVMVAAVASARQNEKFYANSVDTHRRNGTDRTHDCHLAQGHLADCAAVARLLEQRVQAAKAELDSLFEEALAE